MATPEAAFSARVRDGLKPFGLDIERIENRVNLGVADMLVGAGSRFVAVELKAVMKGLKVAIRAHQVAFLARHSLKGRPCFVLVYRAGAASRPAEILLYPGSQALQLATEGLRLEPLKRWTSKAMIWKELAQLLKGIDSVGN